MTLEKARLLIVDDSQESLNMVQRFLEPLKCELVTATNGEEAILRAGAEVPDLIILDLAMPVLDGWETCRYFKVKFSGRFLPILIVSGHDESEEIEKSAEHGSDDYLFKPLDYGALVESVKRLMRIAHEANLPAAERTDDLEELYQAHLEQVFQRNDCFAKKKAEQIVAQFPEYTKIAGMLQSWKGAK